MAVKKYRGPDQSGLQRQPGKSALRAPKNRRERKRSSRGQSGGEGPRPLGQWDPSLRPGTRMPRGMPRRTGGPLPPATPGAGTSPVVRRRTGGSSPVVPRDGGTDSIYRALLDLLGAPPMPPTGVRAQRRR